MVSIVAAAAILLTATWLSARPPAVDQIAAGAPQDTEIAGRRPHVPTTATPATLPPEGIVSVHQPVLITTDGEMQYAEIFYAQNDQLSAQLDWGDLSGSLSLRRANGLTLEQTLTARFENADQATQTEVMGNLAYVIPGPAEFHYWSAVWLFGGYEYRLLLEPIDSRETLLSRLAELKWDPAQTWFELGPDYLALPDSPAGSTLVLAPELGDFGYLEVYVHGDDVVVAQFTWGGRNGTLRVSRGRGPEPETDMATREPMPASTWSIGLFGTEALISERADEWLVSWSSWDHDYLVAFQFRDREELTLFAEALRFDPDRTWWALDPTIRLSGPTNAAPSTVEP